MTLPDPKWKDGPPEGKEVVRVYTVRLVGTRFDPDDDDENGEADIIEMALERASLDVESVKLVEVEDA